MQQDILQGNRCGCETGRRRGEGEGRLPVACKRERRTHDACANSHHTLDSIVTRRARTSRAKCIGSRLQLQITKKSDHVTSDH